VGKSFLAECLVEARCSLNQARLLQLGLSSRTLILLDSLSVHNNPPSSDSLFIDYAESLNFVTAIEKLEINAKQALQAVQRRLEATFDDDRKKRNHFENQLKTLRFSKFSQTGHAGVRGF